MSGKRAQPEMLVGLVGFQEVSPGKFEPYLLDGAEGALFINASPNGLVDVGAGDDNTTYDPPLIGFRVATAGNVVVDTVAGDVGVPITGLLVGEKFPAGITKIYQTGTTATGITGFRR